MTFGHHSQKYCNQIFPKFNLLTWECNILFLKALASLRKDILDQFAEEAEIGKTKNSDAEIDATQTLEATNTAEADILLPQVN